VPTGATKFGDRDELLKKRTSALTQNRKSMFIRFMARKKSGGTSVLYLSSVRSRTLFQYAIADDSIAAADMERGSKIPGIVSVGGVMLFGIW